MHVAAFAWLNGGSHFGRELPILSVFPPLSPLLRPLLRGGLLARYTAQPANPSPIRLLRGWEWGWGHQKLQRRWPSLAALPGLILIALPSLARPVFHHERHHNLRHCNYSQNPAVDWLFGTLL